MNHLIRTCLLLLGSALTVSGQTSNVPVVEYDFYVNQFTGTLPNKLKRNDWVQIRVCNVNPYVYKVVIAERDSTTPAGTPSPILTGFFNTDNLIKVAANIAGAVSSGAATAALAATTHPLASNKASQKSSAEARRRALQQCYDQQQAMADETISYTQNITNLKANVLKRLNEYADPLRLKQMWRINVAQEPAKHWLNARHVSDLTQVDAGFESHFDQAKSYQQNFSSAYSAYRQKATECLVQFPSDKKLRAVDSLIKLFEQEQRPVLTDFAPKLYEKLSLLKDQLINLNNETFSFTSAPLQMTQPMKNVKVTFEPVGTANAGLSSYALTIPLRYRNQPFVGFSSGFFYSGLTGNPYVVRDSVALLTRSQQTRPDSAAHYYRFSPENRGTGEWGVAALVHYGKNICSSEQFHWHVSAGVGLTIHSKPQPRGLLGGGLAFGLDNKLVLTGGLVFGSVETLSDAYVTDKNRILYASPSQFTQSKLKANGFVSLTYNFLNL